MYTRLSGKKEKKIFKKERLREKGLVLSSCIKSPTKEKKRLKKMMKKNTVKIEYPGSGNSN